MKYDDLTKIKIIEEYVAGKDSVKLSKEYGINKSTIAYWLRKEGLTRHRGPKSKIKKEDYFDCIDTEAKAYYLGYIMADGNVSIYNGQYSLKIHISSVDQEVIDNFLVEIESTNKTCFKKAQELTSSKTGKKYMSNETYYVSLTSKHMVESLIKLGVIPKKTGFEIIPDIDKMLIPSFLRGFFDGDGITDISKKRSGFVSNKKMLKQIQSEIEVDLNIYKAVGSHYFLGGCKFSEHLYNYLYSDATIYLSRKKERLWSIIQ